VWLLLIGAESVHGVLRTALLTPRIGDFAARQAGVLTGSVLILALAYLTVPLIRASRSRELLWVGLLWVALTVLFEAGLGHFVLGISWETFFSDYKIGRGGLMPIGLVILALAPLIAAKLRDRIR
jgi:hypothetical protein